MPHGHQSDSHASNRSDRRSSTEIDMDSLEDRTLEILDLERVFIRVKADMVKHGNDMRYWPKVRQDRVQLLAEVRRQARMITLLRRELQAAGGNDPTAGQPTATDLPEPVSCIPMSLGVAEPAPIGEGDPGPNDSWHNEPPVIHEPLERPRSSKVERADPPIQQQITEQQLQLLEEQQRILGQQQQGPTDSVHGYGRQLPTKSPFPPPPHTPPSRPAPPPVHTSSQKILYDQDHRGDIRKARESGYTGDMCPNCQGVRMRRTGTCVTCEDCQHNEGCG